MMLLSEAHVLKARVNTFLGTLLLCSVTLGASLMIWETATGTNPVVKAIEKKLLVGVTLPD
jgi:hypothetical protein